VPSLIIVLSKQTFWFYSADKHTHTHTERIERITDAAKCFTHATTVGNVSNYHTVGLL